MVINDTEAWLLARNSDADTSHEAADKVRNTGVVKQAIVDLLGEYGDQIYAELEDKYEAQREKRAWPDVQPHSIARRVSDLKNEGRVVDTGTRRYGPWGRLAIVWGLEK